MEFKQFKYLVGETVMFCQIIESNTKIIYVNVAKGDKTANWEAIKKESFGSMVQMLQNLDSNNQLLSNDDYMYLQQVAGKRNHWCHQCFINFLYTQDFLNSNEYLQECIMLEQDYKQLQKIYLILEDMRIKIVRQNRN